MREAGCAICSPPTHPAPQAAAAPKQPQAKGAQGAAGPGGGAAVVDEDGTDLSEFLVPAGAAVGSKRAGAGSSSDGGSSDGGSGDVARGGGRRGAPGGPLPPARKPQVIFCSRTHSQLSQFVGELHRTRFADSLSLAAVASRRALCINEQARGLLGSHGARCPGCT
jgi:chromosome transmission fidelity protein 1